MLTFTQRIADECDAIKQFLIRKNEAYGNSVSEPVQVFSKLTTLEQINVRIDDKLSRIAKGSLEAQKDIQEDTALDLIGYLIIKRALIAETKEEAEIVQPPSSYRYSAPRCADTDYVQDDIIAGDADA